MLLPRYVLPDKNMPTPRTPLPLERRDMGYIRNAATGYFSIMSRTEQRFENGWWLDNLLDARLCDDLQELRRYRVT